MVRLILYDAWTAVRQNIPCAAISGGFFLLFLFIARSILRKEDIKEMFIRQRGKIVILYLFAVYCFLVLFLTILSREPGSRIGVRLGVLDTFSRYPAYNVYPLENILLFVPFGILFPLLRKEFNRKLYCFGAGFLSSLLIELIQYVSKRGYAETDDILMNFIGTVIGFYLVKIRKIMPKDSIIY
jgi:glycopeptide antibiotics resistance protein